VCYEVNSRNRRQKKLLNSFQTGSQELAVLDYQMPEMTWR